MTVWDVERDRRLREDLVVDLGSRIPAAKMRLPASCKACGVDVTGREAAGCETGGYVCPPCRDLYMEMHRGRL